MNNHPDLYTMLRSIHDSIQRDLYRYIMMNRGSSGLLPKIKSKPNLNDVIWWNRPIFLYAIKRLKHILSEYPYDDYNWDSIFTICQIFKLDQGKDVTLLGEALRYFKKNYTEELKISKWNMSYITKEMCPDMDDDEIEYANIMWKRIFGDKPYTPNLNNIEPKNSWLERKTKKKK